ncbi:MAG: type 4a pilus biogenesis protein PilO [Elusimicrobia bacterium]|nr:type 4a pilus biogenesis protein PilO [Elusimicrobiota bacterium]
MGKLKLSKEQIQQIAVAVLMTALVGFVYFKYFLKPNMESIKENKAKVVDLTGRVDELEKRAKKRERLLIEIEQAETAWQALKAKLPEKQDMPGILKIIDQLTRRHRLQMGSIAPQPISSSELYYEIPFAISVTGSYHDLAMFLEAFGKTERIFHARNLSISPAASTPERPQTSVSASLTLVTFQYKGG